MAHGGALGNKTRFKAASGVYSHPYLWSTRGCSDGLRYNQNWNVYPWIKTESVSKGSGTTKTEMVEMAKVLSALHQDQ